MIVVNLSHKVQFVLYYSLNVQCVYSLLD